MIYSSVDEIPDLNQPCGLSIGTFDGVHLGHQALLNSLREKLPPHAVMAVFTFSNHPSYYFTPDSPTKLICSPLQKAQLLEQYGADIVILSPFNSEFAKIPYDQFLHRLKQKLGFTYLNLGAGATFGRGREGNEENVKRIARELKFEVNYLPKFTLHGAPLSSGRVRALIEKGALHEVAECLGRPYSLLGDLLSEERLYVLNTQGLAQLPEGIYPVRVRASPGDLLGRAQIFPEEEIIRLELLNEHVSLDKQEVEVIFS